MPFEIDVKICFYKYTEPRCKAATRQVLASSSYGVATGDATVAAGVATGVTDATSAELTLLQKYERLQLSIDALSARWKAARLPVAGCKSLLRLRSRSPSRLPASIAGRQN